MNARFHALVQELSRHPELDPAVVRTLGATLARAGDWELFRINPVRLARETGLPARKVIDFFLHATKAGLFKLQWILICPSCGGVAHSYDVVDQLDETIFHCLPCNLDVRSRLDDAVEVAFRLAPEVKALRLDAYASEETYCRTFISENLVHAKPLERYMVRVANQGFRIVAPGKVGRVELAPKPGALYRFVSLDRAVVFEVQFREDLGKPGRVRVKLGPRGATPARLELACAPTTVEVHNGFPEKVGFRCVLTEWEKILALVKKQPNRFAPFFTAKQFLTHASFRKLFDLHDLPADLKLQVGDITVLFTDLKGSTELYSDTGDVEAYKLVQAHFDVLGEAVDRHSGAIVKTMGDAIMASFPEPAAGVRAAVEMARGMDRLNARLAAKGYHVGLKVGLHRGSAIAVKANNTIDFFGQTVNIAARVQALASAGEIYITDPVAADKAARGKLEAARYSLTQQQANLKGVGEPVTVYRCLPA